MCTRPRIEYQLVELYYISPWYQQYKAVIWGRFLFSTAPGARLRLLLKKALRSAHFYKFLLPIPSLNRSKKFRLLGAVFRSFYRLPNTGIRYALRLFLIFFLFIITNQALKKENNHFNFQLFLWLLNPNPYHCF